MSEAGRQSFTDKAGAALKPDSQKTTTEHIGDKFKGSADSAASTVQPESQKSTSQKAGDTISGNKNDNDDSIIDKTKNALGMGNKST
ncbi:heat shock protein 9/12-domain-containing protein [Amylostereum chailletii]|nr:heat shock protein 9/12-domain-containing protein [Amylostereum chailletii]